MTYSQFGQDDEIVKFFNGKTSGWFVDVGANSNGNNNTFQEKNIALQAAQSALADARVVISKGLVEAISSINKNILYGSLTGNRLQLGGRLQPKQLPWYRIQQFELPHSKNTTTEKAGTPQSTTRLLYRVTILAYGAQSTTQVMLESDFSKVGCEQDHACENFSLRRLNWRLLDQLPADW